MTAAGGPVLVSVLIPTLNEAAHVDTAVAMLAAQDIEGIAEFLFIDGGSTDGTGGLLRAAADLDPRIRVVENPARFIPNALNLGLAAARGEFVARMDAHTEYPSDYLKIGIERLRAGGVDWVSGPQIAVGSGLWSRRIALALSSSLGIGGASFRRMADEELETDTGFTGVWRRQTLLDHAGWDERWQINEDSELGARILAQGGRILCLPGMAASYSPRESLSQLARQYWRYGRYRALTCLAHPASMRRSHAVPPLNAIGLVLAFVPKLGPANRLARALAALYGLALLGTAVRSARRAPVRDAAWLPVVLGTMHNAWGAGFLLTCAQEGVPLKGLAQIAGLGSRGAPAQAKGEGADASGP